MQRTVRKAVLAIVPFLLICAATLGALQVTAVTNSFNTKSVSEFPVEYEDSYFNGPATEYNHKLAQASLGMALSAFRPMSHQSQTNPSEHLVEYLTDCGFTRLQSDDYDKNPSLYTVATVIGQKEMEDSDGQPYTLIAVGVCGGGYANEWLSNFTVGTGERHQGFDSAAHLVENRIFGYIGRANIQGRIKIWISGFSRAAAVSNITAADLVDCGVFRQDDIFAYTFATPRTTKEPEPGRYRNIYNIVGQYDIVPQVPLASWGFQRYGTVLYTSLRETDSTYYEKMDRADKVAMDFTGQEFWSNTAVNFQLHSLLGYVAQVCPTQETYVNCLQDRVISMFQDRSVNNILRTLSDLSTDPDLVTEDNEDVMSNLINFLLRMGISALTMTGDIGLMWNPNTNLTSNLLHEHTQDTYLSWMMSSDNPDDIFTDKTRYTRIAFFNLGKKYTIRVTSGNDDATTVMEYNDGAFWFNPEIKFMPAANIEDTDLTILLPHDETYSVWYSCPEENYSMIVLLMECDTADIAESEATISYYDSICDNLLLYSTDGRKSDFNSVVLTATDFNEESEYLPADFIANSLGMSSSGYEWRTMLFLVVIIPVSVMMLVVIGLAAIIRAVSRKRVSLVPVLFFTLVLIGFLLGELYFWLFKDKTPMILSKAAMGLVLTGFALIGVLRRNRKGLLADRGERLNTIAVACAVLLYSVANCVINISFIAGAALFTLTIIGLIVVFIIRRRPSGYGWLTWAAISLASIPVVLIIGRDVGNLRFAAAAYCCINLLMVMTATHQRPVVGLACVFFLTSDLVLGAYLTFGNRMLLMHVVYMFLYYIAIYFFAYSCFVVKGQVAIEEKGSKADTAVQK